MTTTARKGTLKGYTAFDVQAAENRARNAGITFDSADTVLTKFRQQQHDEWRRRHSPQGRIDRMQASHRAWSQQHAIPYCEADDLDDETWLNYLMRKDERAFAAVKSQIGIDLSNMEHIAWWMRVRQIDMADIFLWSQDIIRDEEAGKKKKFRRKRAEIRNVD